MERSALSLIRLQNALPFGNKKAETIMGNLIPIQKVVAHPIATLEIIHCPLYFTFAWFTDIDIMICYYSV